MKNASHESTKETLRKRYSVLAELLAAILSLVISLVATVLASGIAIAETKPEGYLLIAGFVAVLVIATLFLTNQRWRATQTEDVRSVVEQAYLSALDSSPLNPKRASEENYEPKPNK
jgi:membrane protein YdbS with pleckstrin-like domain